MLTCGNDAVDAEAARVIAHLLALSFAREGTRRRLPVRGRRSDGLGCAPSIDAGRTWS
jgi:hypothetical protein